jgi:uncharacterized membrane protein
MDWHTFHTVVVTIQSIISFAGIFIILSGVLIALFQYVYLMATGQLMVDTVGINAIRLNLGRSLILGLEFIVASDLISTTSAPDYYTVGIVAIVVTIRTVLSFSLNREIMAINQNPLRAT